MAVASFLSSAALLGGTCTAMILGHWYLVIPSLQVSHLQSIVKVHIASMVVRVVVVVAAIFVGIVTWQPGVGPNFERYIFSVEGIFFWQRVLFGLAPVLLAYLTWETAKIRSTQSATGILYVDFFTVVPLRCCHDGMARAARKIVNRYGSLRPEPCTQLRNRVSRWQHKQT
jgi:hypothetical protein